MKIIPVILLLSVNLAIAFVQKLHTDVSRANAAFSPTALLLKGDEKSKRKIASKTLRKVVKGFGIIALVNTGTVSSTHAVAAAVETTVKSKKAVVIGFAVGTLAAFLGIQVLAPDANAPATGAVLDKIESSFAGAMENEALVSKVSEALKKDNGGKNSLLATSLTCAPSGLGTSFGRKYKSDFSLGGLAGFPFGGVSAFQSMANRIPDDGSCLIVFGPRVSIDFDGSVKTSESAKAACAHVISTQQGTAKQSSFPDSVLEAQQIYVESLLTPYAGRLGEASRDSVDFAHVLYDAQKEMMTKIVAASSESMKGDVKIAILGGIEIKTPHGFTDYYLPLSFELCDRYGQKMKDLTL